MYKNAAKSHHFRQLKETAVRHPANRGARKIEIVQKPFKPAVIRRRNGKETRI